MELASELATASFDHLERAGSGGAAEVWKAVSRSDGSIVALKVARDDGSRAALACEARHAALALSPRLPELVAVGWIALAKSSARTVSAGTVGARAFIALSWKEGTAISVHAKRSRDERIRLALLVARDAGEALEDLHAMGFAHGDVKPENLITDHAEVNVIDLGLAGPAHAREIEGGTLRYLARGDADLGDARARDLIALGAVLAEIVDDDVARSARPIFAARDAILPGAVAALCSALLAPNPRARPSAAWIASTADAALGALTSKRTARHDARDHAHDRAADRDARRVRAAYLRIRRDDLDSALSAEADTAPWLAAAIAQASRVRSIATGKESVGKAIVAPLEVDQIARWITALVGSSASAWPFAAFANISESRIATALTQLARTITPGAWTYRDVEAAVMESSYGAQTPAHHAPIDAAESARLALAISKIPADTRAIEIIERADDAPPELVLAAATALRLRGELGRARGLVLRAEGDGWDAIASEVLRRSGDLDLAAARARAAIAANADPDGVACAALARMALDAGHLDEADDLSRDASSSASAVVAGLVASARGDVSRALGFVTRAEALASTAEDRARASGLLGFVALASDPATTREAFAAAVDHATRAGAVIEEATYRTGEAAAAVYAGDLGEAITTARRASLLWEALARPADAARALLASAAAHATAGAVHDTKRIAEEAISRAREGGDVRAEAYAHLAIADVAAVGSTEGVRAADLGAALVREGSSEDRLHATARVLRHAAASVPAATIVSMDDIATADTTVSAGARLDWWTARARQVLVDGSDERLVLAALTGLAEARAPIGSRGPALAAGYELAARRGHGEIAHRLLAELADVCREIVRRAPADLADSVRALDWVARGLIAPDSAMRPEQARDLEAVVRLLGERERLGPLLRHVVDALVLWTGVERGLLLLRAPDGRLVPRAARNLARDDLGPEQMGLSQTLAKRALQAREPVVAVDAAGELPSVHESVHALKLRSVLAVPLIAHGEVLGVAYLDDRVRRGAFGPRELQWAKTIASLAAIAIRDARDQVLLRRAVRRAERAGIKLAETLAHREAQLDATERELAKTRSGSRGTRFRYDEIVGESDAIQALLRTVDRVTAADIPVLIYGESGSGKELVARAIHNNGARKYRPFVSENCGAIPEGLLESALFGHVRGAFTGADRPRGGLFEVADRGTLFLDEIGEMSLGMQAKLLRVLEDGLVKPVGSERTRKVNVRVIAATHRDLEAMVKTRAFREDLLYRLNIITLKIPALRERAEDIPLLVQALLKKHAPNRKVLISRTAMEKLSGYAFPGNVRQLENVIRRAIVLSDGAIDCEHLAPEIADGATTSRPAGLMVRPRIDALETDLVREALGRTKGNQTQAAKLLGLSRFGLQKMIKRLAID